MADDSVLASVLQEANRFVRRLNLPKHQHHFYDDIVQDTMIVVYRKRAVLETLDAPARISWLHAIMFNTTRNTTREELRRTSTYKRLWEEAFEKPEVKAYLDGQGDSASCVLDRALSALSELDRKLLAGRVLEGQTYDELAKRNSMTVVNVRLRLSRARAAARRAAFEEEGRKTSNAVTQTKVERTLTS